MSLRSYIRALALLGCVTFACALAPKVSADARTHFYAPVEPEPTPADSHRLHWDPQWPYFRPFGYVLTGVSVAGALAATFLIEYPKQPRWAGGVLFDDDIRSALRVRQHGARDAIRLASDLTLLTNLLQVAVIDSVVIPLADRSPGIAAQLSLINAQAFALNVLVSTVLFKIVARQRPLISDCERDADFDPLCKIGQYASFPSSHTSTAFTAAGLTCVHHQHLPLYGGPWDLVACIESLTVAFATGLFRSMGDRHYATDVLMGAAIGLTVGYLYPWLSHYRVTSDSPTAAERADPMAPRSVTMPMPAYTFSFGGEL